MLNPTPEECRNAGGGAEAAVAEVARPLYHWIHLPSRVEGGFSVYWKNTITPPEDMDGRRAIKSSGFAWPHQNR